MYDLKSMLVMSLLITSAVARLKLQEEHRHRARRGHFLDNQIEKTQDEITRGMMNCNTSCRERSRDPVCGTNGHTYDSMCDLKQDICKKVNVKLKHQGECSLAEKCRDDRAYRLEEVASGKAIHVPTCLPDGSYAPVQCHNYTLYCWCSRVDGEVIPDTIQKDVRPQCLEDHSPPPAPEPLRQDKCRGKKRKQFFDNMNELIMQGYLNNERGAATSKGSTEKEAIKWKFSSLDTNADNFLHRREYKRLKNLVKNHVKPKKCAKQFPRFCDLNEDKKLAREEWMTCFSSKSRRRKPSGGRKCRKSQSGCKKKPPKVNRPRPSCKYERDSLLEADQENNSIPIPECQPNGRYLRVQCHREFCYCVDELTGNSLEGTAVTNDTPDCSKPMPHAREWLGCTGERKTQFLQDLMQYFLGKVDRGDRGPASDDSVESAEYAAKYHFKRLDKNKNSFLEKKEKKEVKKFLRRSPKLRVCGKSFSVYCDVDSDQKVSMEEWVACAVHVPRRNAQDSSSPKRRPETPNPFEDILKAED